MKRFGQLLRAAARAALCGVLALTALQAAADAASERALYGQLQTRLNSPNNFNRALHIDSVESADVLKGDVYALLDHPFAMVSSSLKEPSQWCDILILPFNTKYCHGVQANGSPALLVRIGRKFDQPVQNAYRIQFGYRNVAQAADYFETRLNAASGPVGTRDYRIIVSAIPVEGGKTFLHLSYSYGYGMAGKIAMQAYLGTVGADKIGFTVTGRDAGGRPLYIGGMRGAVERNAMRYYLAIDAYLDSLAIPREQQVERRINAWFTATERFPRQLHEMDRGTYVSMKRSEYERQTTLIQ